MIGMQHCRKELKGSMSYIKALRYTSWGLVVIGPRYIGTCLFSYILVTWDFDSPQH